MKNLRYVARESRSTVRAPLVGVCAGFKNVCSFQNSFRAHIFLNDFIHLPKCVLCVLCVQAFSSCLQRFLKTPFFFLKRTST
jgi:hypothetical protein